MPNTQHSWLSRSDVRSRGETSWRPKSPTRPTCSCCREPSSFDSDASLAANSRTASSSAGRHSAGAVSVRCRSRSSNSRR
eukprot:333054-Chlamydomonas_euryale.AAC.2